MSDHNRIIKIYLGLRQRQVHQTKMGLPIPSQKTTEKEKKIRSAKGGSCKARDNSSILVVEEIKVNNEKEKQKKHEHLYGV